MKLPDEPQLFGENMNNKQIQLSGVSETLLIPLIGRALETQKSSGILEDSKSLEIFNTLNYDFSRFSDPDSRRSMLRTTIRTAIIDRWVQDFLQEHPDATIVELGCGLNSRFERLDTGDIRWYDLDLPEVYEVWKTFFTETDRRSFLPFSAFDKEWISQVKEESQAPWLFISEASVIYFPENMVRELFTSLSDHFPGSYYLFDSVESTFVESLEQNKDALKYCNARIQWTIEDIVRLKEWVPAIEIIKKIDLESADHEFGSFYPADFQKTADGYQLNLIKF